jgi:hypothetical protein
VVNLDLEFNKPSFTYEDNFLDWYERWLDEIISGDLLADGPSWFGYSMAGDGETLMKKFKESNDDDFRLDVLGGMNKLASVNEEISKELLTIYLSGNKKFKNIALRLLTKFNYPLAVEPLRESIQGNDEECMIACSSIYSYHNSKSVEWTEEILQRLPKVNKPDTFSYITYLLQDAEIDYGMKILPFCNHQKEEIRVTAFYNLGLLKGKKKYLEEFKKGLEDNSARVVHTVLQALFEVKSEDLLPYYDRILEKYKTDENYILCNLMHRLKEIGGTKAEKLILKAAKHDHKGTAEIAKKCLKN